MPLAREHRVEQDAHLILMMSHGVEASGLMMIRYARDTSHSTTTRALVHQLLQVTRPYPIVSPSDCPRPVPTPICPNPSKHVSFRKLPF